MKKSMYNCFKNHVLSLPAWLIFLYGALSGKMLFVRIVENIKIDAYFRVG